MPRSTPVARRAALGLLAMPALPRLARAQRGWPDRPLRFL